MRKILLIAVLALLAAAGWRAGVLVRNAPQKVAVVHPVRGKAALAVYATGTVEPVVMLPAAPRVPARLAEMFADEGDTVYKGQPLARFEDADLHRELDEAEIRAAFARDQYDRKAGLVESGAVSREETERERTAMEAAEATVARLEATIEQLNLSAPEDGAVIRREGEIGQLIPAGQPVFWLASRGLRVTAEVDEEDVPLVKPGLQAVLRADAYPDKVFEGTVDSITPKGDPIARSYRVRVTLDDADVPLMIGMTAETNIIAREKDNALLVPVAAVRDGAVFVVEDKKAKRTPVETGVRTAEKIEILSGVSEESLVIGDAHDIEDGTPVRAIQSPLPPGEG